jgi:hypothetical protein
MFKETFTIIAVTTLVFTAQFAQATTNEAEQTDWSGAAGYCMPRDEDSHMWWKSHAGDVAVAEWNWTYEFPNSRYLKNLWWDPFIMFEKEVTW